LKDNNENIGFQWSKFAGLASQWAVALVGLLFLGKYLDQKHFFTFNKPLFTWLLPFVFILFSLVNIIKETNNKSKTK
jgi:dolichyl-phosphate-mannose--protein O-mannosyl transferase